MNNSESLASGGKISRSVDLARTKHRNRDLFFH